MDNTKHAWWGTPRKITNFIRDRKISWLELFSDLVFIIAIHYLISGLSSNINTMNFFRFVLIFLLVFDVWNTFAIYFDLHGNTSVRTTFFTLLMVLGVALLSSSIESFFEGEYLHFILIYLLLQVLIMYLWIRIVYFDPQHMLTTRPYLIAMAFQFILLIAVTLLDSMFWQSVILTVVVVSKCGILVSEHHNFDLEFKERKLPFEISSALQERYGTFTMIVLGESIATVVEHLDGNYSLISIVQFLLLSLNIIGIFWMYYALMDSVHIKGKNYLKLVCFRGFHIGFLLVLSLETFFLVNLLDKNTLWMKIGFIASLIITICLIFILKEFSKTTKHETRDFLIGSICLLVLFMFIPFRPLIVLTVSDVALFILVILHERALYLRSLVI